MPSLYEVRSQIEVNAQRGRQHYNASRERATKLPHKTGFICEFGFNIVASATRDGRKIVAVVLGEPSVASRNQRATDLLEKGFRRHFWKSLFGSSLDGLAIQPTLSDSPTHLRDSVCGGARAKSASVKSKHGLDARGSDAPASAVSASEAN